MQADRKLFEDIARMASGAMGAFGGVREQIRTEIRLRVDTLIHEMDMVTREEFEAVQAMAEKARREQEKLRKELKALKAGKAKKATPKKKATKTKTTTKKKKVTRKKKT